MPAIVYEGRTYVLKRRRIKCLLCGTLAETSVSHPRDFVACSCGATSIDGGIGLGATINGDPATQQDVSVYRTESQPKATLSAEQVAANRFPARQVQPK